MIKKIKATPLGGVGETGALNCMVYETANEAIVVDSGAMFPDETTLGVDLIIPDFTYLHQIRKKLKAIVLTHGHEDHIGSVPFLLRQIPLPVYASPFTTALLRNKLKEHALPHRPVIHTYDPGDDFKIGSFQIETIFVNHSIPDAAALGIRTEAGTIMHVTDWKVDKTPTDGRVIDIKKFEEIGKRGVLALFSDSTNVGQAGKTLSEREVITQLKKICGKHKGRILVALFSSNIQRIQGLAQIAKSLGRTLALVGRSMKENTALAREINLLSFDGLRVLDVEETKGLDSDKVMLLVTGSQGEPRSALSRMAAGEFKPFKVREGDLVLFSSKVIPGNERNIFAVINNLCRRGARVLYESVHEIHTSGHAHQEELKMLVKKLKPEFFVPIHGEYRQLLKHGQFAADWGVKEKNVRVIENGQTLVFQKHSAEPENKVPVGRIFVDEASGDLPHALLRDRRHLSGAGLVVCVVMIDHTTGEILRGPDLISKGLVEEEGNEKLLELAKKNVCAVLESINWEGRTNQVDVQEEVRLAIRRFFRRELNRKPVVIPVVLEM